nr:hypothetical protein [Amycolatopsis pretoriensis]
MHRDTGFASQASIDRSLKHGLNVLQPTQRWLVQAFAGSVRSEATASWSALLRLLESW